MAGKADSTSSSFDSILGWAGTWPLWQRDALRRIVCTGRLSDRCIDELQRMCLKVHGISYKSVETPEGKPLTKEHLPTGPDGNATVTLVKLADVTNVNRLATGQVVDFGPALGLTIVFGENGSGKSGYARIVKKACRARGSDPVIKPNALTAGPTGPARAKITFQVGGTEVEEAWRDGVPADPRLANVFVFDSASAAAHVGSDEPVCFVPRGLDVLPKLAEACEELKRRSKGVMDAENVEIAKARGTWKIRPDTAVGKVLASVSESTDDSDIEGLAVFTKGDGERLVEIVEALRSDPRRKAEETAAKAARVKTFLAEVAGTGTALGDDRMEVVRETIEADIAAEGAVRATAGESFDESYLPGTGNDAWRRLWSMAEAFSGTAAYPGMDFPPMAGDARCVLCQRTLDAESRARFEAFSNYIRDAARKGADTARQRLEKMREEFSVLAKLEFELARVVADLTEGSADVQAAVKAFAEAVDLRLVAVRAALAKREWIDLTPLPPTPVPELESIAARLDARAKMELSADDPIEKKKLVGEREALEDREWLAGAKADVLAVLGRYRLAAALKKALGDTTTNQITICSGKLQESFVTHAFCDAFKREVVALGLRTLPVEMKSLGGEKGTKPFGIRLSRGTGETIVGVASEGEERCVAIAAFLAELALASHRSALVFDDPVSSLDHFRRGAVAVRMVEEAQKRQVVVFTHDPVFLGELLDASERAKITVEVRQVSWSGDTPGYCENGLPWDWQKYKDRINALEAAQRRVASSWSTLPNPANVAEMRAGYNHFRATLERVLQDVIFNGVIARYRSWIRMDNIEAVVGFCEAECGEITRLHKRACDVTDAHDPAPGKHAPVPTPTEFLTDIDAMKALVEAVKTRRKKSAAIVPPSPAAATAVV